MFNNSNLAKNVQKEWHLPQWSYLLSEISKVFSLNSKEIENLSNSTTAKIIATIPFESNCKEPERTAISHLCLYIAELKGFQKYCSHNKEDDVDIYNRLAFISTFEGGKYQIIEHGMAILALIMIEGYKKSKQKDEKAGVYNPLVSGTWNYQSIKNSLIWKINKLSVPNLDILLPQADVGGW